MRRFLALAIGCALGAATAGSYAQSLIIRSPVSGGGGVAEPAGPRLSNASFDGAVDPGNPWNFNLSVDPPDSTVTLSGSFLGAPQYPVPDIDGLVSETLIAPTIPGRYDLVIVAEKDGLSSPPLTRTIDVGTPAALTASGIDPILSLAGQWAGTVAIDPAGAALQVDLLRDGGLIVFGGDDNGNGLLESGERWDALSGGLTLIHNGNSADLEGQIDAAGQYQLTLRPGFFAALHQSLTIDVLAPDKLASAYPGESLGGSVGLVGSHAIIGAVAGDGGIGAGYLFDIETGSPLARLTPGDGDIDDNFSVSAAFNGTHALFGSWLEDRAPDQAQGSGYLFENVLSCGAACTETAKLIGADDSQGDNIGLRVAISDDYALIGGHNIDAGGHSNVGAAYLYKLDAAARISASVAECGGYAAPCFKPNAKLTASDAGANDQIGWNVAENGSRALVGSNFEQPGDSPGAAYLFNLADCDDTNCSEAAKLVPSDGASGDIFGFSVDLVGDLAIVGATGKDSASGAAYLFDLANPTAATHCGGYVGTCYQETARFPVAGLAAGDHFGFDVVLAGNRATISAWMADTPGGAQNSGAIYLFDISDVENPQQLARLTPNDPKANAQFGVALGLSGPNLVTGANLVDGNDGAIYVFQAPGGSW